MNVVGGSRAGEATLILLPQLRLALDPGRAHRSLPPMSTVVVSHGHTDHLGGLAYWASQRFLNSLGPGLVLAPEEIAESLERLLELHASMEGGRPYGVTVCPMAAGATHALRADTDLRFFATDHWVATLATQVLWRKRRLRLELSHLRGEQIAARRQAGEEVSEEQVVRLLTYCADSGPELFEEHAEEIASEVLLVECSFFASNDQDRARHYGHSHLDDLVAAAASLRCRHLVLLHASRRHRLREVEDLLDERLRPLLSCELHHLNVNWE